MVVAASFIFMSFQETVCIPAAPPQHTVRGTCSSPFVCIFKTGDFVLESPSKPPRLVALCLENSSCASGNAFCMSLMVCCKALCLLSRTSQSFRHVHGAWLVTHTLYLFNLSAASLLRLEQALLLALKNASTTSVYSQ